MSDSHLELLKGNKRYVADLNAKDPHFFEELSAGQKPEFLWIGCSDSRIPATEVTGTTPGSIFVHRNIANMVIHTDSNLLSVVDYAVNILKVKHIIVCGHYNCGGINAALSNESLGFIDGWISHIKDVYRIHKDELAAMSDEERSRRLVELNILEQVQNLSRIPFIQNSWKKGEFPYIHGWVYDLRNGLIQELSQTINCVDQVDQIFKYT